MKGAGKIPPTKTLSPSTKESLLQASWRYRVAGITSGSVALDDCFLDRFTLDGAGPATARPDSKKSRSGLLPTGLSTRFTDCYSTPLSQLALALLPG